MTTQLLIIGLDGATLDLIEPWARAGHLPNLAALIECGSAGRLTSTVPAMTLPAWSTFLTGCYPGRHGMFDFTRRVPGRYAVQFVNSTHRREPTFLRRLSDAGCRVAALGVPTTYPPEPINGALIAGFDSPVATNRDASFAYPPELYAELQRATGGFPLTDLQELRVGPGWHRHALCHLTRAIDGQLRAASYLLRREVWDCFVVVFGASDTVSHHFWAYCDPDSPRFDAAGAAEFGDAIRRVYEQLDRAVGRLWADAGPCVDLLVVSDHGFGGTGDIAVSINRYLNQSGLLAFTARRPAANRAPQLLKQAGLRLVPSAAQQAIFRRMGGLVDWLESGSRFGHIDWTGTLAYSEELNYFPSVWINRAGREPGGIVPPADYERIRDRVIRALHHWRDEITGQPVVRRACRREELYAGPALEEAPDVVVELAYQQVNGRAYSFAVEAARTPGPPTRRLAPSERIGAKGRSMNGSHRPDGILMAAGPSIHSGASLEGATLADIAPTLLTLLGHSPDGMEGRVLTELLADTRQAPAMFLVDWAPQPERLYSAAEAAILAGRLRSLGYIE